MKTRVVVAMLLLGGIGYLWWQRRRTYAVPGVGRIRRASDTDFEYWKGVYEAR